MGLDIVELVMEIEEAFDVSIPDDRASRMMTVGDVYEFILEKTADASLTSNTCLTAATFYDSRRQIRLFGGTHEEIRPRTAIGRVIPHVGRRAYWNTLSQEMELRFPRLERPSWLTLLNCILVAAVAFSSFLIFAKPNLTFGLVVAGIAGTISAAVLLLLTRPFAIYPESTCTTVRDLVTKLVAMNYSKLSSKYSTRNPTDIWNTLQLIVCEQLGVEKSAVVSGARFVQDLGAD